MMDDEKLKQIKTVARALGELADKMVFLGGSVVGLLMNDESAPPPRETIDIDMVTKIPSLLKYHKLSEALRAKGFMEDTDYTHPTGVICRWKLEGSIVVDIMPTKEEVLGFSNSWYAGALKYAEDFHLDEKTTIKLISVSHFIATKLEAFKGRGEGDFLMSHDLEDVITLVDGRQSIVEDVMAAPTRVRKFIAKEFRSYLKQDAFRESISSNLRSDKASQGRYVIILDRIKQIAAIKN